MKDNQSGYRGKEIDIKLIANQWGDANVLYDGFRGYAVHRIPGIVCTKKNTVLMVCEAREKWQDSSNIDILLWRSDDYGETFTKTKLVDGVLSKRNCDNAVLTVGQDNTIYLHSCAHYGWCPDCGGKVLTKACEHGNGIFMMKSTDDGLTWSEPIDIAYTTEGISRLNFAFGPGHGICTTDGTLLIPTWSDETIGGVYYSYVRAFYSTDNGETWQLGEKIPSDVSYMTNESEFVCLSNGNIRVTTRLHGDHDCRGYAISKNGFTGWSEMKLDKSLVDPASASGMIMCTVNGETKYVSVNCYNPDTRDNLVVSVAENMNCETGECHWTVKNIIQKELVGYSDIAMDSEGRFYVLYEASYGEKFMLARFGYDWIKSGEEQ